MSGYPQDPYAPQPPRSDLLRLLILGILVIMLIVSLGVIGFLVADRGTGSVGNRLHDVYAGSDDAQTERDAVEAVARQFMLRQESYGPDLLNSAGEMPEYRSQIESIISPKFQASFVQAATTLEALVKKYQVTVTGEVYGAGVASMDSDSATALVAGSFTASYPSTTKKGKIITGDPIAFRVTVDLVLDHGNWLVDNYTPVKSSDGTGGDTGGGSLPTGTPSAGTGKQGTGKQGGGKQGGGKQGGGKSGATGKPSSGATKTSGSGTGSAK